MLFSIIFFFNVLEKSLMLYDQLHYFQSLRATTLVELKFLAFNNSKSYFIYFNTSLYKSLNISDSIFLPLHLNILSFSLFVSLFITLSMWPTFFTFLTVQFFGHTCLSWERNKNIVSCSITCSYSKLSKMTAPCSSLVIFFFLNYTTINVVYHLVFWVV